MKMEVVPSRERLIPDRQEQVELTPREREEVHRKNDALVAGKTCRAQLAKAMP